jgi:hypothetical protein
MTLFSRKKATQEKGKLLVTSTVRLRAQRAWEITTRIINCDTQENLTFIGQRRYGVR